MTRAIGIVVLLVGACASGKGRDPVADAPPTTGDGAVDAPPNPLIDMGPTVDMGSNPPVDMAPPPDGNTIGAACNVIGAAGTGCSTGEKCTWYHDDMSNPPLGHIACAPNGAVAIGAACTYGAPGATGYDNCVAGSVCVGGVCEAICDPAGGAPACGATDTCVRYSGLFGPVGGTLVAGVCEPQCDPIADNDYDGAGTMSVKTGTACGADVNIGCYGIPSDTTTTAFICAAPAGGTETRVHRQVLAASEQFLNSCHPGYTIAFASDATGSTNVDCYAYCRPGNSYMGAATQEPNGKTGHQCRVASSGRQGNFGAIATATVNGEHCMYSWNFEVDDAGILHRSPTSDTVGLCWDHTKYNFDHDGNAGTPNIVYPACGTLPLTSATALTAVDFACVDTTLAGFPAFGRPTIERRAQVPLVVPAFDPRFSATPLGLPSPR